MSKGICVFLHSYKDHAEAIKLQVSDLFSNSLIAEIGIDDFYKEDAFLGCWPHEVEAIARRCFLRCGPTRSPLTAAFVEAFYSKNIRHCKFLQIPR